MIITNSDIRRILIDSWSSSDILFYDAFFQIRLSMNRLRRVNDPLVGFSGNFVIVEGDITPLITLGQSPQQATSFLKYLIIRVPLAYNVILGWLGLKAFKAMASTCHLLVWFPTKFGIGEIQGDEQLTQQCFMASTQNRQPLEASSVTGLNLQDEEIRGEPTEQLISVPLRDEELTKTIPNFMKNHYPFYARMPMYSHAWHHICLVYLPKWLSIG